ncbi:D-alanine--D-alanine ligase family protein [Candidatus Coxiella mudrowiae]|uniref:D-alanine--D-alanine ligase n=1 Tax=Candidatus Coxiella mudrowiae TaxID=2054173 RepID=A0ABM5UUY0_9COXI|nr:D-alanine--D-alanine ligase family protein [Candidatus Coxiella mudrowiae]AKQ33769.1 D-alanine--D-alanine ligase [Candidatus Coxiella mudrowiae]
MEKKLTVSVLCGGRSPEHEISIQSARNIVVALSPDRYKVSVVYIDQSGKWYLIDDKENFLTQGPQNLVSAEKAVPITIALGEQIRPWRVLNGEKHFYGLDCVFPMIHGTQGEDGVLQGLLELLNLPYVGANVQSSAICIEKDITKSLLRAAKVPVVDWHTLWPFDRLEGVYERLIDQWETTELFMKAVSLGSSVAIFPVKSAIEFQKRAENIFCYDDRLIVEPRIYGREIECAVLGNGHPKASLPAEIISNHDFYSYEAKYLDPNGATTTTSVNLPEEIIGKIQQIAIDAFKIVRCSGMARVDFFVTPQNQIMVNEINTIPGFTNISMYPKMWEATGLSYSALLDRLIELALERHQNQQKLIRRYPINKQ